MNNSSFLYYETPSTEYQQYYGHVQAPFEAGKEILTQLPKNIAVIRAVATVAFTSLLALKLSATVFCWPIVIAGLAFAGWTIYSHLLSKDPLMETFYKIVGGKDEFEKLPPIDLAQAPNEKIFQAISRICWDNLNSPIAKTRTLDGRNVMIIKGLSRNINSLFANCQTKGVLAFIERTGPKDLPRIISNLPELADSIMHAVLTPHEGNTFGRFFYSSNYSIGNNNNTYCMVYSSISSDMANELFAQVNNHHAPKI